MCGGNAGAAAAQAKGPEYQDRTLDWTVDAAVPASNWRAGARECETVSSRHCERSEAIHASICRAMDCFASLAMTWRGSGAPDTLHSREMTVVAADAFCSDRKAGPAAARRGGIRIDHPERGADQVVDEIDLGARQERHRGGIDQHYGALARNHQIILGLRALDVELVLEAGAAATLDTDAQHGAVALGFQDFPDAAGRPLADGDVCLCHNPTPNPCRGILQEF